MENKKIRVGINGAGRIGRAFLRLSQNHTEKIEIVVINDLSDIQNVAYLIKYDTAYGPAPFSVKVGEDKKSLIIEQSHSAEASRDAHEINFISEKDPSALPWKDLNIDVVIEATGAFTKFEASRAHINAGAKKVVLTAPAKDDPKDDTEATVVMGINDDKLKTCQITSNASCTTNSVGPVMQVLNEKIGVEKAILNTIHGYTSSQPVVDGPAKKDFRKGRAAAQNIIPTTTGAAIATTKVITDLEGKFDGIAMRVPVIAGSVADITFIAKKETSVEEINNILKEASKDPRWKDIFTATEDPIVSSDIVGSLYGSIADLGMTRVIGGNLVKVCAWYDNEMGYTSTLLKHVLKTGQNL